MKSFSQLTYTDGRTLVSAANKNIVDGALEFYSGKHWRNGEGWVGAQFDTKDAQGVFLNQEVQRVFTPANVVKETVDRVVRGVLGKEPSWALTVKRAVTENAPLTPDERELIAEAEALLTTWFDAQSGFRTGKNGLLQQCSIHRLLKDAATRLCYGSRGPLRVFVPPSFREGSMVPRESLEKSIAKIFCSAPALEEGAVVVDADSARKVGVFLATPTGAKPQAHFCYIATEGENVGKTIIRVADSSGPDLTQSTVWLPSSVLLAASTRSEQPGIEYPLALNGRLLMAEISGEAMVDEPMIRLQKQINKVLTVMGRNVDTAGFVDEVYFNAQKPGTWVEDPTNPTGDKIFKPAPMKRGSGTSNFLVGVQTKDKDGKITVASPSRDRAEPIDSRPIGELALLYYRIILQTNGQLHALLAGDAVTSGEARKQAMADFLISLLDIKEGVEWSVRWLLETVLQLAATLSGEPDKFVSLRVTADCRLYVGPKSKDDIASIVSLVEKNIWSRQRAQAETDVDDSDAEDILIYPPSQTEPEPIPETSAVTV